MNKDDDRSTRRCNGLARVPGKKTMAGEKKKLEGVLRVRGSAVLVVF